MEIFVIIAAALAFAVFWFMFIKFIIAINLDSNRVPEKEFPEYIPVNNIRGYKKPDAPEKISDDVNLMEAAMRESINIARSQVADRVQANTRVQALNVKVKGTNLAPYHPKSTSSPRKPDDDTESSNIWGPVNRLLGDDTSPDTNKHSAPYIPSNWDTPSVSHTPYTSSSHSSSSDHSSSSSSDSGSSSSSDW